MSIFRLTRSSSHHLTTTSTIWSSKESLLQGTEVGPITWKSKVVDCATQSSQEMNVCARATRAFSHSITVCLTALCWRRYMQSTTTSPLKRHLNYLRLRTYWWKLKRSYDLIFDFGWFWLLFYEEFLFFFLFFSSDLNINFSIYDGRCLTFYCA